MTFKRINRQLISIILATCLLISIFVPFIVAGKAQAAENPATLASTELADKAVRFINDKFKAGENIDGYAAYVLTAAGEDLTSTEWVYQGATLKQKIIASVDAIRDIGTVSGDVYYPNTKTVALDLLALSKWQETDRINKLADLLIKKHTDKGFENSVYSDMWAYIALGEAGKIGDLDAAKAKSYILGKQSKTGDMAGAWGETWGDAFFPDFLSTAQAIRALTYLPGADSDSEIKSAIDNGLAYLKKFQQSDGSIYVTAPWPDDPVVDTSEVIITLKKLGQDPASWKNSQGLSPVDYMLKNALNVDGSFGPMKNVFGAAEALSAFLVIDGEGGSGGTTPSAPVLQEINVDIAVVGKDGDLLFGPDTVILSPDDRWGLTALGALDATGLDYVDDDGFVKSIEGQANSGMNGWMYKVNGRVPKVLASEKAVEDGDEVIWWYSTDYSSSGPTWGSLLDKNSAVLSQDSVPQDLKEQNNSLPTSLQASGEALDVLGDIQRKLGIKQDDNLPLAEIRNKTVVVVGRDKSWTLDEIKVLKKQLKDNSVNVSKDVASDKGAIIADEKGEVALAVPEGALKKDVKITVKETGFNSQGYSSGAKALPQGFLPVTDVYSFGPDGTTFNTPVTVTLKIAPTPLINPDNISMVWFDEKNGKWVAVPAVVDVSNNIVIARVKHFSDFAVAAKESRKDFADIDASHAWAKDNIELLAGAGILNGIDGTHFEPQRGVTRAEFVSMLARALNLDTKIAGNTVFKDVKADAWYAGAIQTVSGKNIITGYEDGTFRPNNTITRQEMAVILTRALKLPPADKAYDFKDLNKISSWSKDSVYSAVSYGLLKGFEDGTFKPADAASRAQCAVIIYRILTSD